MGLTDAFTPSLNLNTYSHSNGSAKRSMLTTRHLLHDVSKEHA